MASRSRRHRKHRAVTTPLLWCRGMMSRSSIRPEADELRLLRNAWRERFTVRVRCPGCGRILDWWKLNATYYGALPAPVEYDPKWDPEPTGFELNDRGGNGKWKVGGLADRATVPRGTPNSQHEMEAVGIGETGRVTYRCGAYGPGCGATPTVRCDTREQMFVEAYLASAVGGKADVTLP